MQFKVNDKVKVMRRSTYNEIYWNPLMDKSIGKTYKVLDVSPTGNLYLETKLFDVLQDRPRNFFYPQAAVKLVTKNQQLLFEFMNKD